MVIETVMVKYARMIIQQQVGGKEVPSKRGENSGISSIVSEPFL